MLLAFIAEKGSLRKAYRGGRLEMKENEGVGLDQASN